MNLTEEKQQQYKSRLLRIGLIIVFALVVYSARQNQRTPTERISTESLEAQKQRAIRDFEQKTGLKASSVLKPGPAQETKPSVGKTDGGMLPEESEPISNPENKASSPLPVEAVTKQSPTESSRPPPELGQLRDLGGKVWESAAGLKYGPGSQEKHRLLHVMKHAEDQPDRPGKHGVFDAEGIRKKVLALIDEAYLKAINGGKNVTRKKEGARIVYTVDMGRPIGFVGGRTGKQQGNPKAYKIRLVLEGTNVITAFPL